MIHWLRCDRLRFSLPVELLWISAAGRFAIVLGFGIIKNVSYDSITVIIIYVSLRLINRLIEEEEGKSRART